MAESAEQQPSRFYIYMVDVVYGLIIANSFLDIGKIVFPPHKIFNLEGATLAFGAFFVYYFVLSGWYGLHKSISKKPFDPDNIWSKIRFAVNLFIIFLEFYLFTLATGGLTIDEEEESLDIIYKTFMINYSEIFIWVILAIYVAYLFWDGIKIIELSTAHKPIRKTVFRTLSTLYITLSFGIMSVIYQHLYYSSGINKLQDNIVFIGISLILVIVYRVILKRYKATDLDKSKTTIVTTTTTTTITGMPPVDTNSNTVKKIEPETDPV